MFHYVGLQAFLWLFFHTASLFWGLRFPFHFRSYQSNDRTRYILVAMTTAGLLVPLVPALVPLAGKGYGFVVWVPPITCATISLQDSLYPLYIPMSVIGAPAMCLLIGIFWIIIKVHHIFEYVCMYQTQVIHGIASAD